MKRDQAQLTMMACFCFIMSLLFSKVRPYRSNIYNYFDMSILCNLTIIAFLSNGKLNLPLWDHNDTRVNDTVMVLLWVPLVMWLIVLHWRIIQPKFLRVCSCFRNCYITLNNLGWFLSCRLSVDQWLNVHLELRSAISCQNSKNKAVFSVILALFYDLCWSRLTQNKRFFEGVWDLLLMKHMLIIQ